MPVEYTLNFASFRKYFLIPQVVAMMHSFESFIKISWLRILTGDPHKNHFFLGVIMNLISF